MLSVLNIRLAARIPLLAKSATCHVARPNLAFRPPTRSFWSSTHVEEPPKPPVTKIEVEGVKPEKKKRATKAKAGEKKPKRVVIPKEARPPKGPSSPYIIFFKDQIEEMGIVGKDTLMAMAVKAGENWRALSDEEKATYTTRYRAERDKYKEELGEWFKQADPSTVRELNKKAKRKLRAPKLPGEPRRPPTAFFLYLQERRDQQTSIDNAIAMRDIAIEAGKGWRDMTAEQKTPYKERFNRMLEEYFKKKAAYSSSE
ncbi:hypothetical protein BDZ94DRAFT_1296099 [Collybia nuda]|uniref:HMG box domain-containing protein n=1 Tax=Collybia nuda TaxID=64659 RepID=A0A9P5YC09_9AGAR|nr:hypothetical protein BDZ94DRAFT_1296099 [Collybia nuda]